jgi:hypothetical protein
MGAWNRNTFGRDNGVPAGIVNVKDFVSDGDFERIKREWRSSYGGPQRRTAFLRGGSIEWHDIGLSHTDLDFLQGRQANRDEILNIFGVPVGLVSENATEANARVAERSFIERTLWPKLVRLSQKISQELLPFWPGDYVAVFEDIRPTDVQARLDEIRTAQSVLSINEVREKFYHLPPVEWGAHPVGAEIVAVAAAEAQPEDPPEPAAVPDVKAQLAELSRWETFALKRWDRPGHRPFEPRALPEDVVFEVRVRLSAVDDVEAARTVFRSMRDELQAEAETITAS